MITRLSTFTVNRSLSFIILFTLLTISCAKEETPPVAPACCDPVDYGEFLLLPSSRLAIPYQEDADLYFKNAAGGQVMLTFRADRTGYDTGESSYGRECECDAHFTQVVNFKTDSYIYMLNEPLFNLGVRFLLTLGCNPNHMDNISAADVLDISLNDPGDTTSFSGKTSILVDQRDLPEQYLDWYNHQPADSINLLGKTFYDVYMDDHQSVWYTFQHGLVGFLDRNDDLWVIDSVSTLRGSEVTR